MRTRARRCMRYWCLRCLTSYRGASATQQSSATNAHSATGEQPAKAAPQHTAAEGVKGHHNALHCAESCMVEAMCAAPWRGPRTGKLCTITKRPLLARGPNPSTTGCLRVPPRHRMASRVPCAPGPAQL